MNTLIKAGVALLSLLLFMTVNAADYQNNIGMKFVKISKGCFMMGRDANFEEGHDDELPRHKVCIKKDFWLGQYEVTQAEWVAVMGSNPSTFKGRTNPVEQVSWDDIQVFIQRLNKRDKRNHYRLPSESEWEYAARAGTTTSYYFGDDVGDLGAYAWFDGNSGKRTHPVGKKQPNAWGLYDMSGNVWEWVADCYHNNYIGAPVDGSVWNRSCNHYDNHPLRGGSWSYFSIGCRAAGRASYGATSHYSFSGFRLVRVVSPRT